MQSIAQHNNPTLRFHLAVQTLVAYTFLVILWGAWVRISHSGDGCGDTWPLCQGQLIPEAEQGKTWVEFTHRMMSGLFGIIVLGLYLWGRKVFPKGHLARFWGLLSLIFTVTEALLGAKLVLFKLVGSNDSAFRAFAMGLHFINSAMLTGSIYIWSEASRLKDEKDHFLHPKHFQKMNDYLIRFFIFGFAILGTTGTLAALSTTLFPSTSLLEGLMKDLAPDAHWLLRARLSHPIAAIIVGGTMAVAAWVAQVIFDHQALNSRLRQLAIVIVLEIIVGIFTLGMLSPLTLKLLHLAMAHLLWIFILRLFTVVKSTHPTPPNG